MHTVCYWRVQRQKYRSGTRLCMPGHRRERHNCDFVQKRRTQCFCTVSMGLHATGGLSRDTGQASTSTNKVKIKGIPLYPLINKRIEGDTLLFFIKTLLFYKKEFHDVIKMPLLRLALSSFMGNTHCPPGICGSCLDAGQQMPRESEPLLCRSQHRSFVTPPALEL